MSDHYDRYNGMDKLSTNLASLGTDCISRQQAIDAARDWYEGLICGSFKGLEKRLRSLPPAQPERKTGKWFDAVVADTLQVIVCDQCNTFFPLAFGDSHNFCPNCGAKMEVDDE